MCILLLMLMMCVGFHASPYPFGGTQYRIDCGGQINSTDGFNNTWMSDRYVNGGYPAIVSEPLIFQQQYEKTLRFFPITYGKKNCYSIPISTGRYMFRTFTVYDNYDGRINPPSFDVSVQRTHVFSWRSPWPQDVIRHGAYSDLFAYVDSSHAQVCFYSVATDSPVVSSLEITPIHPLAYSNPHAILINYGRLACGARSWGPGLTLDLDPFGRSWQSDSNFRSQSSRGVNSITTSLPINGTDGEPNYFPARLFQFAATGNLQYDFPIDARLDYSVWLHFSEIDPEITGPGQRVFDVLINNHNLTRVDIFNHSGGFSAYTWNCTLRNLTTTLLTVKLVPVVGTPLINGLENYALVPYDLSTLPEQAMAMSALKESFLVPARMGWNGDPCSPTNWDAWEGVTCHINSNGTALVISQIDLGSQGLKGHISDEIGLLSDLVFLNLSSNSFCGPLPLEIGQNSLKRLDLSHNQISGSIPVSLITSNLQLVLLNDNLLEGQVPEQIFSISVHGGEIDLTGNKGLCGGPSLPTCPSFWKNGSLSTGGKIAIILSSTVFICLILFVLYICYIRRRDNDYDFGLPQDLMSLAAKHNRYQRQKSLMLLEMESQHAKGLSMNMPSPFP